MSAAPAFLTVVPGAVVACKGRRFEVTHLLDATGVLARDLETQGLERLRIDALRLPEATPVPAAGASPAAPPDLQGIAEEDWQVAQRRLAAIRPLLNDPFPTRAAAEAAARAAGVGVSTIYGWIRLYQDSGRLSDLIPLKRGPRRGLTRLAVQSEAVVAATIEDVYLTPQKLRAQVVVERVLDRCRQAGIPSPHPNTIRNRLKALPAGRVLRRRGQRDVARNLLEPVRSSFPGADFPLAVVQIDHSEADVIVVEDRTRLPMGRPWITLAIDVFSRMVVGIYVSMDRPSAAAAGLCLSQAMLPKGEYLAALDVPGDWPAYGRIRRVHADNAREFRGTMLRRACEEYGIDLDMRPVKTPHYDGHIERLMGTAAGEIRKLPGATFSSPVERRGYDSDAAAALTLSEFERHLTDFLVNTYHRRIHAELDVPPMRQWEVGVLGDGVRKGVGLPDLPGDPERLRLDFMPFVERTVQPYGIVIDDVYYYDEVLNSWINAPDADEAKLKRSFVIRRDPRDISQVWFLDPEAKQYFPIPYRNTGHPPISLWELRAARQRLKEEGRRHVNEDALFEAAQRLRQRIEESVTKTKAARRHQHQIDRLARRGLGGKAARCASISGARPGSPASLPGTDAAAAVAWQPVAGSASEDDIFAEPVLPFDDVAGFGGGT